MFLHLSTQEVLGVVCHLELFTAHCSLNGTNLFHLGVSA